MQSSLRCASKRSYATLPLWPEAIICSYNRNKIRYPLSSQFLILSLILRAAALGLGTFSYAFGLRALAFPFSFPCPCHDHDVVMIMSVSIPRALFSGRVRIHHLLNHYHYLSRSKLSSLDSSIPFGAWYMQQTTTISHFSSKSEPKASKENGRDARKIAKRQTFTTLLPHPFIIDHVLRPRYAPPLHLLFPLLFSRRTSQM